MSSVGPSEKEEEEKGWSERERYIEGNHLRCSARQQLEQIIYTPKNATRPPPPPSPPPLLVAKGLRIRPVDTEVVHFPFINWHFIRVFLSRNREQSRGALDLLMKRIESEEPELVVA